MRGHCRRELRKENKEPEGGVDCYGTLFLGRDMGWCILEFTAAVVTRTRWDPATSCRGAGGAGPLWMRPHPSIKMYRQLRDDGRESQFSRVACAKAPASNSKKLVMSVKKKEKGREGGRGELGRGRGSTRLAEDKTE